MQVFIKCYVFSNLFWYISLRRCVGILLSGLYPLSYSVNMPIDVKEALAQVESPLSRKNAEY